MFTLKSAAFYHRPLAKFSSDPSKPSYGKQQVGVCTLKKIVPNMCEQAGCIGRYTNHSLRAMAITRMYNAGVPEKLIAETSGHKSTKALHQYKHTSQEQQKAVTSVLNTAPLTCNVTNTRKLHACASSPTRDMPYYYHAH